MKLSNPFDHFRKKQTLYRLVFENSDGRQILEDLASFCYCDSSTFDRDPQMHARNEGRRQVALYILDILNMKLADLGEATHGFDDHPLDAPGP